MDENVKDPMGQAISDFQHKKPLNRLRVDSTITEDEEIDISYLFRSYKQMPLIEKKALDLCKGNVLDVGAGSGSHALHLQDKNIDVVAIDSSALSIETMLSRGVNKVEQVNFFKYSQQKFNTLLFLMNGIGIAGDLNGLNLFLAQCKSLLLEGGQVLLDSSDIIYMYDVDGTFSTNPGEYYGEIEYQMSYGTVLGEPFKWLYLGFELLKELAEANGFTCELVLEGEHFDYLCRLTIPS